MASTFGKGLLSDVLAALPERGPGLTLGEVHDRMGMWSKATVGNALAHLAKAGLVVIEAEGQAPRRYWKAPAAAQRERAA